MPIFQINEPFISGHDFFAMIDHYLTMLDYIRSKLYNDETFMSIKTILENNKWKNNTGFKHANLLFECAVLCYYDRFHNLDFEVVKKLFKWSFMLRIDRSRLGGASINCYAIGEDGHNYSNEIAIFFEISHARLHKQVAQRTLNILKNGDIASKKEWEEFYESLKNI